MCCARGWAQLSLGFIADASQPARHHDIEQIFRQRTRQYKVELKKLEAIAAKERERALAEERAHARRLAALGDAAGGVDDQVIQREAVRDARKNAEFLSHILTPILEAAARFFMPYSESGVC